MERWRITVAIVAALAALPLLAIDNVSSADPERPLVAPDDPAITDQMWIDAAKKHFRGQVIVGKDLMEI